MSLSALLSAIDLLFSWPVFGFMILGVLLGILVGMIPGLGSAVAVALLLPLTFPLDGLSALILLLGIYSGVMYSGSVPAILMNTPGSGSAAAATFDGYPLSKQGRGKEAVAAAATASALGGFFGITVLILMIPIIVPFLLLFGTIEYFLVALLGILLITVIARGAIIKGILAGACGLAISTIGMSPIGGQVRYTHGYMQLHDGLSFVAIILGLFAIAEMLKLSIEGESIAEGGNLAGSVFEGVKNSISKPVLVTKSSVIGILVGAIPGAGTAISTFVGYGEAMRSSKEPETFGEGNIEGVIAVDSTSNATISGSLMPTLAFGIPGGSVTAVLLGGLIMHGLNPGPHLFDANLDFTYAMLLALFVGNFVIILAGIFFVSQTAIFTKIDVRIIIPSVISLAMIGSFILNVNWVDTITVVIFGIIGYYMLKHNYSVVALLLGVILGPIAEENFVRGLHLHDYSILAFASTPLRLVLIVLIIVLLLTPIISYYRE